MPHQARTIITAIKFATIAADTETCKGDIRAGVVRMTYTIVGRNQVQINTQPGGPVPPPPDDEPQTPPGNDPVIKLLENGWKVTDWVMENGQSIGQAAGFGIGGKYNNGFGRRQDPIIQNPDFEKLSLSFAFPMYCTCVETKKCNAANFRFSIEYDGTAHPKIALELSDEGDCATVAARPINKEARRPETGLTGNTATYTFKTGITCDCGEPEGSKGKCPLTVICEYDFRTEL